MVEETVYSKAYRFESDEMLSLLMAETLGLYRRVGWRSRTAGVTSSSQSSESVAVSSRRSPSDSLVASFDFIVGVVGIGVSNADLVSTSIVASGSGSKSSPLGGLVPSGMCDFGRPKIVRDFSSDMMLSSKSIRLRCQLGSVLPKYAQSCDALGTLSGSAM